MLTKSRYIFYFEKQNYKENVYLNSEGWKDTLLKPKRTNKHQYCRYFWWKYVHILHLRYNFAVIRWADVDILLAVLLAQRQLWQMTLARCHFAHRPNVIANGCFDVIPTPLAQLDLHANHCLSSMALGQRWFDVIQGY